MSKSNDEVSTIVHTVAEQAIQQYADGLLSVTTLVTQMYQELAGEEGRWREEELLSSKMYRRVAQRLCSRALCEAWHSNDERRRNYAFDNIRRYLHESLLHSSYARRLQEHAHSIEDVLHQTMEMLYMLARKKSPTGPTDPGAFLKWTQTILVRQAHIFLERSEHFISISLEQQQEHFAEQFVDTRNSDPLDEVLRQELRAILINAVLALRNPKYRHVLLATYILNQDDRMIALQLQSSVQEVYMWRYRALEALRKHPAIIRFLQSLRE